MSVRDNCFAWQELCCAKEKSSSLMKAQQMLIMSKNAFSNFMYGYLNKCI